MIWYGIEKAPPNGRGWTVRASNIQSTFAGLEFDVDANGRKFPLKSPLVGRINVYNILLACSAALSLGLTKKRSRKG